MEILLREIRGFEENQWIQMLNKECEKKIALYLEKDKKKSYIEWKINL